MTVTTVATVGFGEIIPVAEVPLGGPFTLLLVVTGTVFMWWFLASVLNEAVAHEAAKLHGGAAGSSRRSSRARRSSATRRSPCASPRSRSRPEPGGGGRVTYSPPEDSTVEGGSVLIVLGRPHDVGALSAEAAPG
jgi:hypothetical protein